METYSVRLKIGKYIAHPFWPETSQVVNVQKISGLNRVRSEDKREAALTSYLKKEGMTTKQYDALIAKSKRQWYRKNNDDDKSKIIIPMHQIFGMLVHGSMSAPAGCRVNPDNVRSVLQVSDFETNKVKADGVFSRYVLPTGPDGKPISNQRRLTENEYVEEVEAVGRVTFDQNEVKAAAVKELFEHSLHKNGIGASRKMGYGRGVVKTFTKA